MEKTDGPPHIGTLEKLLVGLDVGPFGALYRVMVGYVTVPTMSWLCGGEGSDRALVPFLLGILLALRTVPAVVRRLLPFSEAAQSVWAARRQTAKRYDSYQWRKLLWIGAGLMIYSAVSGQLRPSRIAVCLVCLLSGALGMARWRSVASRQRNSTAASPASVARTVA